MSRTPLPTRRRQRGVSPIEILIGLVLALLLVAGLGQLVGSSRQSTRVEQAVQQLQETGRFAVEMIGRESRKTGFRNDRLVSPEAAFPANSTFAAAGAVVVGTDSSVTLRYQGSGDAWTRTCLGDDVAAGVTAEQTLSVVSGELRCRARNLGTGSDQTQPLLANVEAISITYGVDTDGDWFADAYRTAGAVTDWRQVVSLNVQLRTVSTDDNLADAAAPYVGFDGSVATPNDRRLRRNYAAVVALRNLLP